MKKFILYNLYYKSIPKHLKWKLGYGNGGSSEWLTDDIKNQINLIIAEDTPTTQDITENEANIILDRIVGGEVA